MSDISRANLLRATGLTVAGAAAAITVPQAASAEPSGQPSKEHPNVTLIRGYYAAYAKNDLQALRERFFAPDITWTIPGHHPLAGTMKGVDEVLAFFAQLARAGFQAETIFLAADGDRVVDLHRGWSTDPKGLDITWALAFRIEHRRIASAINYPADQHLADAYFWQHFPLADIPQRLHRRGRPVQ